MSDRPSVLVAVIVYDGQEVVPASLRSAVAQRSDRYDIDVLVLDDCSPSPGWSGELAVLCKELGVHYHRNVRNLGIPRNMGLGLLAGVKGGYDHVVLANSDTVIGAGVVGQLAAVADDHDSVGSVTAWSNNVSVFSLESNDYALLCEPETVDLVDSCLRDEFGSEVLDLPTGVGFFMSIPVRAIERVGVPDPIFGRGYCEEVDWCQRARLAGYRNVLALGTFVFHEGSVSTKPAGLLTEGSSTVWGHELIIDHRYPEYRQLVGAFCRDDAMDEARDRATHRIVRDALAGGYEIIVGTHARDEPAVTVHPDTGVAHAHALGFTTELNAPLGWTSIVAAVGHRPRRLRISDFGAISDRMSTQATADRVPIVGVTPYPRAI